LLSIAFGGLRNMSRDKPLGVVEQHSRWLATLLIANDLPAKRIFRFLRDAADLQCRAVGDGAVSISAVKKHRVVR
jgi:hypothetical protein